MVMGGCLIVSCLLVLKKFPPENHMHIRKFLNSKVVCFVNVISWAYDRCVGGLDHEGGFQISAKMHGKN